MCDSCDMFPDLVKRQKDDKRVGRIWERGHLNDKMWSAVKANHKTIEISPLEVIHILKELNDYRHEFEVALHRLRKEAPDQAVRWDNDLYQQPSTVDWKARHKEWVDKRKSP